MDAVLAQRPHQALDWSFELAHGLCPVRQYRVAGHASEGQDQLVGVVEAHKGLFDVARLAGFHQMGTDGVLDAGGVQSGAGPVPSTRANAAGPPRAATATKSASWNA